jgi:hypothetical protein
MSKSRDFLNQISEAGTIALCKDCSKKYPKIKGDKGTDTYELAMNGCLVCKGKVNLAKFGYGKPDWMKDHKVSEDSMCERCGKMSAICECGI